MFIYLDLEVRRMFTNLSQAFLHHLGSKGTSQFPTPQEDQEAHQNVYISEVNN